MAIKNLIFIEDDILDYEVYSSVIDDISPETNCIHMPIFDFKKIKEFTPEETVLLLDLNLNGVYGLDLYTRYLKVSNYVVLIHTSSDNPRDLNRCENAGLKYYFLKKVGRDKIESQMLSIINFFNINLIK